MEPLNQTKAGPKDVFLQIALLVGLYTSVTALLALIFDIVNITIPDVLSNQYYYAIESYSSSIRFEIATLIIIFPLFALFAWIANKDFSENPTKLSLWTRRWSSYLNLFASIGTIAVTLVMILNDFLGGELSARFVWKALATLIVAAVVLAYFFYDIRKGANFSRKSRAIFLGAGLVLVLGSIISAFFVTGSPAYQRLIRLDSQRVNDLQSIQYQIANYWQQRGALPATLTALEDPISGYRTPTDPEGKAYSYKTTGKNTFEICAEFSVAMKEVLNGRPAIPEGSYAPVSSTFENWQHEAGVQCFARTIDPLAYPVKPAFVN